MKVVRAEGTEERTLQPLPTPGPHATRRPAAMQGRLEEVPLPDLLQLLAASRKTGVLALGEGAQESRVHLGEGRIAGCTLAGAPGISPQKAFARLLALDRGPFELRSPEPPPASAALDVSLEGLLMEGLRQLDEWRAVAPRLPPGATPIAAIASPAAPLRALSPEELDVFQLALGAGTVQVVLDRAPGADSEVAARLLALAEKGYVRIGK
jgi:hypothetical protein